MIYGSVCSGIEAASVAWHPLGWTPSFFSEIDAFPRAVLAHHYPGVPLHGDFTTIEAGQYDPIDLLVGGTPCQSFSVAGLRAGLDDDRGNLALEFCLLARRLRPRWVVWENVPGVLSLDGGRAFASILGGLAECGYGLAYRVLDAQFVRVDGFGRAVPQRRRRVFVVGHLGDWRRAAAVLFERASLSGDSPPRRQAGEVVAQPLAGCSPGGSGYRNDADTAENLVAHTLNAKGGAGRSDSESETFLPVAHALRADGFDASEDGTGRGTPLVPVQGVALRGRDEGATAELTGDVMTALRCGGGGGDKPHVLLPIQINGAHGSNGAGIGAVGDPMLTLQAGVSHGVAIAFDETQITSGRQPLQPAAGARPPTLAFHARQDPDYGEVTHPLDTHDSSIGILQSWRVRRLMPVECERLQGFPDGYTAIPFRGKPAADGPRYKALGNSMAVNVMRWIGRRIEMVEAIREDAA